MRKHLHLTEEIGTQELPDRSQGWTLPEAVNFQWPPRSEDEDESGGIELLDVGGEQPADGDEAPDAFPDSPARFPGRESARGSETAPELPKPVAVQPGALRSKSPAPRPRIPWNAIAVALLALVAVAEAAVILRSIWFAPANGQGQPVATGGSVSALPAEASARPSVAATSRTGLSTPAAAASRQPLGTELHDASTADGQLIISSQPARAEVVVNGKYQGLTPLTLSHIRPGEYRIAMRHPGGASLRQTVKVDPGATVSIVAPLRAPAPSGGWIAIDSPIELDVLENGVLIGTSRIPQIAAAAGSHEYAFVNREVAFREARRVDVRGGATERIVVSPPPGMLFVNAVPWADVWIDGRPVGQTPIGKLAVPIGRHEIVFRHPDLGEKTMAVIVKAGEPTRLSAVLKPQSPASQ